MSRLIRTTWPALALAGALGLWSATGRAGGDKAGPWQPFIPADAAKELTQRSIKKINELAKSGDKNAQEQLQAEAVLLAGTTVAAQDGKQLGGLRASALKLADAAGGKGGAAEAKKLAATFGPGKANGTPENFDWRKHLDDLNTIMYFFRPKAKGGEGTVADLQYTGKLKNLNSVEDLIGALASKKLTAKNVEKVSKELPLLAYRVGVIGAITHDYGPTQKGKGDLKQWQKLSDVMRDASVSLAAAAQKKDTAGIHEAAKRLEASCTDCHRAFR